MHGSNTNMAPSSHGAGQVLVLPEGVTEIPPCFYQNRSDLIEAVIPEGVTGIGDAAFHHCGSLEKIVIPRSVAYIGKDAFFGCGKLKEAVIPEGVDQIARSAFFHCDSLVRVSIPEGVTEIGPRAFGCCGSLEEVVLPSGVRTIGAEAFKNCRNLRRLEIGDGLKRIGKRAFEGCVSLTWIRLPKDIVCIDDICLPVPCVVCYTPYAASFARYPVYLGGKLTDLKAHIWPGAVRGFLRAGDFGISVKDIPKDEYHAYIRAHLWDFIEDMEENGRIVRYLIGEDLLDREGTDYLLEAYERSGDVETKAALLSYRHNRFGREGAGGESLLI